MFILYQRELPTLDNPLSHQVRSVVNKIQTSLNRNRFPQLQVVRQQDPLEPYFMSLLVEDKSFDNMNYVDYLCYVHRQIQVSMTD
jgi:protein transport protein SEC24